MFADAREDPIAFVHVNVVPMTSETILYDQTVVVEGDQIVEVGPSSDVEVPKSAVVIDGQGSYLMPGLADMHMHTNQNWDSDVWPVTPLALYLANGVTTIRDFGPEGDTLTYALQWRDEIQVGTRVGPTIYASGKILFASPLGDPVGEVDMNHHLGFDFLKLYSYLSLDDTRAALTTASRLGMYSAGHIPYPVGLDQVLIYGMDEIAHIEELMPEFIDFDRKQQMAPDEWLGYLIQTGSTQIDLFNAFNEATFSVDHADALEAILTSLKLHGAPVCTTLVIDDVIHHKLFDLPGFLNRPEAAYLPAAYQDSLRSGTEKHQVLFKGIESLAIYKYDFDQWLLRQLHEADIPLLLGTDSGILAIMPGFAVHDELQIMVANGFSPYEAIATSTINAANAVENMLGEGNFGRVAVGMRADLLLIHDNPLEDITAIQDLQGVMAAGRWFSAEALAEIIALPNSTE
ncbi:MAG TPA: amidohydrolase family protein [Anaerolineae bacterium]|nr:amidohydrolase family protein [Anaerolineae bacterium]